MFRMLYYKQDKENERWPKIYVFWSHSHGCDTYTNTIDAVGDLREDSEEKASFHRLARTSCSMYWDVRFFFLREEKERASLPEGRFCLPSFWVCLSVRGRSRAFPSEALSLELASFPRWIQQDVSEWALLHLGQGAANDASLTFLPVCS